MWKIDKINQAGAGDSEHKLYNITKIIIYIDKVWLRLYSKNRKRNRLHKKE